MRRSLVEQGGENSNSYPLGSRLALAPARPLRYLNCQGRSLARREGASRLLEMPQRTVALVHPVAVQGSFHRRTCLPLRSRRYFLFTPYLPDLCWSLHKTNRAEEN